MFVNSHASPTRPATSAPSRPSPSGLRSSVPDELSPQNRIAYQGEPGANSDAACREGHPQDTALTLALEELAFFSVHLKMLGAYPASPFRAQIAEPAENRQLRPTRQGNNA